MEKNPDNSDDFRVGDEAPDAFIDGFKVYGGTPEDRAHLQSGDGELLDELDEEIKELLEKHSKETGFDG